MPADHVATFSLISNIGRSRWHQRISTSSGWVVSIPLVWRLVHLHCVVISQIAQEKEGEELEKTDVEELETWETNKNKHKSRKHKRCATIVEEEKEPESNLYCIVEENGARWAHEVRIALPITFVHIMHRVRLFVTVLIVDFEWVQFVATVVDDYHVGC